MSTEEPLTAEQEDQAKLEEVAQLAERMGQLHRHLREIGRGKWFHEKQMDVIRAIYQDGKKRIFARKGRKGGGTQSALYPVVRMAGLFPNMACYLIYPTLVLGKEIVWSNNRLLKMFPAEWKVWTKENETRIIVPHEGGNSFIRVMGADNHKQMVGIEGDVFVFDELKDHDPRAYKNCYPNIASRDALWFVLGAPPKNKNNFYYITEQAAMKDPDWFCIHWSSWANAANLPGGVEFLENEKRSYYARGEWDDWEVEWEARYVLGGKRNVIPHFDKEKHAVPYDVIESRISKDKEKLRWYIIVDPGFATCFHVMFMCINSYTGEVFILDEVRETDRKLLSVKQLWPRVVKKRDAIYKGGAWKYIYDSAAPGFPQEVRASFVTTKELIFRPTFKQEGDEDKYFRIINTGFHSDRFLVNETCTGTISELEDYLTDEHGNYPDENNHALDDFRYGLKADNYKLLEQEEQKTVLPDGTTGRRLSDRITPGRRKSDWAAEIDPDIYCEGDDLW